MMTGQRIHPLNMESARRKEAGCRNSIMLTHCNYTLERNPQGLETSATSTVNIAHGTRFYFSKQST